MRLTLKQMLWLWLAIIMMIGLLFGMAYQRFNSDVLVEGLKKELKQVYPDSIVKIGNISTSFLIDINLMVQSIEVERNGQKELRLNQLELKIPWWSLLLESGRVQLNIEGLVLNLPENRKLIDSKNDSTNESQTFKTVNLQLPPYLLESSLNIRVKDIELIDPKQNERRLKLSKVIIRDYQVGNKTAFELNIPLSIKWGGVYSGEIWLFGDFITNGDKVDINWRADSRGFKQEEWNLNDLFIEGSGSWGLAAHNLDAKIALMQSSKKISELDIKITKDKLSVSGPINQIPLETIKPLLKQFHPRTELSFYKGSELGTGHFSWNKKFEDKNHHFDLKLGFEGEFYQNIGIWNFQWTNDFYNTQFISADKKLRLDSAWDASGVSNKVHLDGKEVSSAFFDGFDPFYLVNLTSLKQELSIYLNNVVWNEKIYSGSILLSKNMSDESREVKLNLKNEKSTLDFSWLKGKESKQKFSLTAQKFPLGPFGTYFHYTLSDSATILTGKISSDWEKDIFLGKGMSSLQFENFSTGNSSWLKYWEFISKTLALSFVPNDIQTNFDWSKGIVKIKKINVKGNNVHGNVSGKLDFNGKKSELSWHDQLNVKAKKNTKTFIIDEFMRTL